MEPYRSSGAGARPRSNTRRNQFGETIDCEPSRFIEELPADDLQFQGGGEDESQANEERGQETLAGLKSLFG